MLDWEQDKWVNKQGKVTRVFNPTFDDVVAVASEMRKVGISVVSLYTGAGYWGERGRPTLAGNGFDLVNARWGLNPEAKVAVDQYRAIGGDDGNGWDGFGGLDPVIWQFGSRIAWGSKHMDHNAFRGDAADAPPMVQGLERRREGRRPAQAGANGDDAGADQLEPQRADDRGRRHLSSDRRSCSPGRSTRGGRSGRSRRFNVPVTSP